MIFPPPNLTVFWVNLGSMWAPVGLLQYLRRLWCNSTEDSSEKSTFCHFSSVHTFGRLWALAKATRFFNCLLFSAGFWVLIRLWRPFQDRIRQTVLVDTGTSGDRVSWSSAAVEKGLVLLSGCLAGSAWPGLVKNVSSLFISLSYPLYLTLRHIEGVCHLSSGSGLQPLDNQHFGLRVNLRHVVRGQVVVDVKGLVYWGSFYTHPIIDCSIIGHRWSSNLGLGASYDKATRLLSLQKFTQWALPSCER